MKQLNLGLKAHKLIQPNGNALGYDGNASGNDGNANNNLRPERAI